MRGVAHRRLPVSLPRAPDELLSSWIDRHAAFYCVPPLIMLRHCLPGVSSLRAIDMQLTGEQARDLSEMLPVEPDDMRRMTFANITQCSRRLICTKPAHSCPQCVSVQGDLKPVMRSQMLGWRITCPLCGGPLRGSPDCNLPSPFHHHWNAALCGEKLIDDEAEYGFRSWASPTGIARLLLMRRRPIVLSSNTRLERFRVLGAILPELDEIIAGQRISLPSPASPILPLHLRPALLAGIAIVERSGPAMLEMLQAHTIGENQTRFGRLAAQMSVRDLRSHQPLQLQLI